jgi:predicted hydrolase (HD superfamily)
VVERSLKPCPLCAEIPNVEGEELPRELQDVVDDLYGLLAASEQRAKKATDPEESKRHYLAAGCTRDGIRMIEVLYFKLNEAVGPTPRTLV